MLSFLALKLHLSVFAAASRMPRLGSGKQEAFSKYLWKEGKNEYRGGHLLLFTVYVDSGILIFRRKLLTEIRCKHPMYTMLNSVHSF